MAGASGNLLMVGVGQMGRPYMVAADRLGVGVQVVETAARVGVFEGRAKGVSVTRGDLEELWAEASWAAASAGDISGVIAFSESHVLAAALIQETLDAPGPGLHAAVMSRNKALQRGRFRAVGICQPDYMVARDLSDLSEWARTRLPVVVKPLSSAGSAGVELVRDEEAYRDAADRRRGEGPLLIEVAVDGPEYSWEALIHEGEIWFSNITAKETSGPPHFVEVAHRTGVRLQGEAQRQVAALGEAVVGALAMRSGIVHLEFRLGAAGPTVMEVAVRTPGDYLMDLLGSTYGIDWFEILVRLAMSMSLPDPPGAPQAYAASYFPMPEPGEVMSVEGLDAVRSRPCVDRVEITVRPGDSVAPIISSAQRPGYAILVAPSPQVLEDTLAFVRETLVIRTRTA